MNNKALKEFKKILGEHSNDLSKYLKTNTNFIEKNKKLCYGNTLLHILALSDKINESTLLNAYAFLIEKGWSIDKKNKYGQTAFHYVCCKNDLSLSLINFFLHKGADPNIVDNNGLNVLHSLFSAPNTSMEVLKEALLLIVNKIKDINQKDKYGDSVLIRACTHKNISAGLIKILIKNGAELTVISKDKNTLMHHLLRNHHVSNKRLKNILTFFIKKNKQYINQKNSFNETIIHMACCHPHVSKEIIEMLINAGIDLNIHSHEKTRPIHTLLQNIKLSAETLNEILSFVLPKINKINDTDVNGNTVLHFACQHPNISTKIIDLLLEYGANPNIENNRLTTPIYEFLENQQITQCVFKEGIKLLVKKI